MTEPATRREDLLTMLFGAWLVVGLFVDAFNHVTNPELETFWTPWHALFYSGFTATAIWVVYVVIKRRQPEGGVLDWAPPGYRLALIGLAVFGLGGIGDAIWHTVFGVETGIDALLSPTHLMLWVGGILILTAPMRAAWITDPWPVGRSYRDFLPVILSMALTIAIIAFFFVYGWHLADPWAIRHLFDPDLGIGDEAIVAFGVVSILLQTFILMGPALVARQRWALPFGTATTVFLVTGLLQAIGFDRSLVGIPALGLAGLVFDLTGRRNDWVAAVATPAVLFAVFFATLSPDGVGWPVEVWSGSIVLAVALSVGMDVALRASGALHDPA